MRSNIRVDCGDIQYASTEKGDSTAPQSSLLLVVFCALQHYSWFVHLISRQPLGSDTSPIAYYTARGVRSVIGVVASQGKATGLRNKVRQSHQW